MNKQWSGTTNQTLKAHIDRHQSAFVSLSEASDHVSHQLPNDRTRVGYLIDSITSTGKNVVAALASIHMDDTGQREDFEEASILLAQIFPITKNKGGGKPTAKIGAAGAKLSSGVGSTGVELRYYKSAEFMVLTPQQRVEVSEYKATKDGGKWKGNGKGKGKPLDKKLSQNDGGLPSEKNIKSMISEAFADDCRNPQDTCGLVHPQESRQWNCWSVNGGGRRCPALKRNDCRWITSIYYGRNQEGKFWLKPYRG